MAKKSTSKSASKFLVGAGVAAAVAAGIVTFLTQSKQGKLLVKKGREHAQDLAHEVAARAEKTKNMTKAKYDEMVDSVVTEYAKKKKLTEAAAKELTKQLKKEWAKVQAQLKK